MSNTTTQWALGIATSVAFGLSVLQVGAQMVAPPAPGVVVAPGGVGRPGATVAMDPASVLRIRKMPRLTQRDYLQRTPTFINGSSRNKPREWAVFEVLYDTAPLWIDELTVSFTLMLQSQDPAMAQTPFSVFRLTSRYIDVAKGSEKVATAVLLPSAIARYGKPIGLVAEFSMGGQVLATEAIQTEPFLKDRWWENAAIMDSARTVKREGYLLERSKTPFALVNIDDSEVSK